MASKLIIVILSLALFFGDSDARRYWRKIWAQNSILKQRARALAQKLLSNRNFQSSLGNLLKGDSDIGDLARALEEEEEDELRNDEIFKLQAALSDIEDMRDDEEAKPEHDLLSESFHRAIANLGDADSKTDNELSRLVEEAKKHAANFQGDNE